jgi:DNA repair exonuclease SbcCD ATPase subunit
MARVLVSVDIQPMTCPSCGVHYGLDETYRERRRDDAKNWYCPNGHSLSYRETEADRLRRQLGEAQQHLTNVEFQLRRKTEALTEEKRTHARLRKRVGNGVCPCCNRSFVNLQRHMSTQHPGFTDA